ncbi:alpha/beta hydrolase [Amycolatopsis sp. NBC_01480]|uniref:alpha/beta hydrolase n=1 Tax=Amycolatopsis sp. NBC_01480 TaxID=2903562 RepID=UPI002E288E3C|nr:alpha/beta fold hydrolase [Amycolatopsis sp. NBC_01480]
MTPTFVLVHGSNGNGQYYAPLQRELALLGHRSLAVDLPGHGNGGGFSAAFQAQDQAAFAEEPSPLAGVTHADGVAHVIDVVRRAREHGPVVLAGHSRGGFMLTSVANAVPELLERIVYVSAWCCVDSTAGEYLASPENASSALMDVAGLVAGDPAKVGALRMNWRTTDPALLATLKRALLADGTDSEFYAFLATLEPDECLDAGSDRAEADTWGRVPHSYVRLTGDQSIPVALQDRFVAEADALTPANPFDVHSLDSGHLRALLRPSELAGILAESVTRRSTSPAG